MSLPAGEEQVAELQQLVQALTIRVDALEQRLETLEASNSGAGFEVVGDTSAGYSAGAPESAEVEAGEFGGPYCWTYRETVAKEIGQFLRRAIDGSSRGSSGREKLGKLTSRYYLVIRDVGGNSYHHPVRVLTRFNDVRALCQHKGEWGDSIFVGVPSKREGSIAARTAGLTWPASIQ